MFIKLSEKQRKRECSRKKCWYLHISSYRLARRNFFKNQLKLVFHFHGFVRFFFIIFIASLLILSRALNFFILFLMAKICKGIYYNYIEGYMMMHAIHVFYNALTSTMIWLWHMAWQFSCIRFNLLHGE